MTIEPARWQELKRIVAEALELEGPERERYVRAQCGADPELLREALALVTAAGADEARAGSSGILDDTALVAAGLDEAPDELTGRTLGPYRVLRKLGEGGMGVVYEAEESHPARRVALKVLRARLAPADAHRRFEQEVDVLGRLEHDTIARLYRAGRDDELGVAYFAMELVQGAPLTEAARGFSLTQKLALLARVADGVEHAHRHGVLHRDLKPDNVLVTQGGAPKVLDFGIARLIDAAEGEEGEGRTRVGQLIGTLSYMSPEQVRGDPRLVDVRSDVYALGVIGYQLCVGRLPHELSGLGLREALRRIEEQAPPAPGRLVPALRGDLERILLGALAKERELRYATAADFADDLRRVLRHEPIRMRSPTLSYVLGRFARRHRAVVAASALAFVLLVVAVVGTTIGLVRAERERARAVAAAEGVREINEQLLLLVGQIPPERLAGQDVVGELLRRWEQAIERGFAEEPLLQAEMRESLGWAQYNLGLHAQGAQSLQRAVAEYEAAGRPDPRRWLRARDRFIQCRSHLGIDSEIVALAEQNLAAAVAQVGARDPITHTAQATYASMLHGIGRLEDSLEQYERAIEALAAEDPLGIETLTVRSDHALVLRAAKRVEEAEVQYRIVDAAYREHYAGRYPERALAAAIGLAQLLEDREALEEARSVRERIVQIARSHWGEAHPRTLRQCNGLVRLLRLCGANAAAAELARETARLGRRQHPASDETLVARNLLVHCLLELEQDAEAEREARSLVVDLVELTGEEDARLWTAREDLANALVGLGRHAEAEALLSAVLALREKHLGPSAPSTLISANNLAWLLVQAGQHEKAAARYATLLDRAPHAGLPPLHVATFRLNHGRCLLELGRTAPAEAELRAALAVFEAHPGTEGLQRKARAALARIGGGR